MRYNTFVRANRNRNKQWGKNKKLQSTTPGAIAGKLIVATTNQKSSRASPSAKQEEISYNDIIATTTIYQISKSIRFENVIIQAIENAGINAVRIVIEEADQKCKCNNNG